MKNLRIRIPLLLLAAGLTITCSAETLSPEQALSRVFSTDAVCRNVAPAGGRMTLSHTSYVCQGTTPAYYVFDKPQGGYLIVTADDRLGALLADVDSGSFDMASVPANMKWWLSEYEREINWFLTEGPGPEQSAPVISAEAPSRIIMQDKREDVEPMLSTKWDQSAPYNQLCPTIGDKQAPTGCVATAMAQIVNHHQWPATHGFGQHSYTYRNRRYFFDYENTTFDWKNMRDSYDSSIATDKEKNAVATLMYACGVGVDMEYNDDQSGAVSFRIAPALRDYLGYPECTSLAIRDTYSLWEWEELMYQEMAGGRPVCYSGVGGLGGHQFVLDGYRADNMFHINWGWSGISDGYFRLTSLNPPILGTGGGGGAFNYMQEAVVGICRPDKSEGLKPITPTYINGDFTVGSVTNYGSEGCYLRVSFPGGGMYANVTHDLTGMFGVLITDEMENELGWFSYQEITFPAGNQYGVSGYHSAMAFVPQIEIEGTYRIYPAFQPEGGEWTRIPVYNGYNRFLTLYVDGNGRMTFQSNGMKELPELEIVDLVIPSDIYRGVEANLMADCLNGDASYSGQLYLYMVGTDDTPDTLLSSVFIEMTPSLYDLRTIPTTFDVEPGEYAVYFADCLNRRISSNFTVKVLSAAEGVDTPEIDSTESQWFDLQGRPLPSRPTTPGIYIERRGTRVGVRF